MILWFIQRNVSQKYQFLYFYELINYYPSLNEEHQLQEYEESYDILIYGLEEEHYSIMQPAIILHLYNIIIISITRKNTTE